VCDSAHIQGMGRHTSPLFLEDMRGTCAMHVSVARLARASPPKASSAPHLTGVSLRNVEPQAEEAQINAFLALNPARPKAAS
jgi:hypothetical protein